MPSLCIYRLNWTRKNPEDAAEITLPSSHFTCVTSVSISTVTLTDSSVYPATGSEIRAVADWGRSRHLTVTEAPSIGTIFILCELRCHYNLPFEAQNYRIFLTLLKLCVATATHKFERVKNI